SIGLSDGGFAPLIIVDTLLSYGWMALLIAGAAYQRRFDRAVIFDDADLKANDSHHSDKEGGMSRKIFLTAEILLGTFLLAAVLVKLARFIAPNAPFLSATGWALLISSTAAV